MCANIKKCSNPRPPRSPSPPLSLSTSTQNESNPDLPGSRLVTYLLYSATTSHHDNFLFCAPLRRQQPSPLRPEWVDLERQRRRATFFWAPCILYVYVVVYVVASWRNACVLCSILQYTYYFLLAPCVGCRHFAWVNSLRQTQCCCCRPPLRKLFQVKKTRAYYYTCLLLLQVKCLITPLFLYYYY